MRRGILFIAALIAVATVASVVVYMQGGGGEIEYKVSLWPTNPVLGETVHVKAVAYSTAYQDTYNVTCNVTVTNSTDVLWFDQFSGDPAQYEFTWWRPDNLTVSLYCVTEANTTFTSSYTVSFRIPQVTVEPLHPRWGRSVNLRVEAEYPYTGTPVTITVDGTTYNRVMSNGVAVVAGLVFTEPANVTVRFLNHTYTFYIEPRTPSLDLLAPQNAHLNQPFNLTPVLVDDEGVVPASVPVSLSLSSYCGQGNTTVYTGETVQVVATHSGSCRITGTATVMGSTLSDTVWVYVPPPRVVNFTFDIVNLTSWDYTFTSQVVLNESVNGSLTLLLDGQPVASDTGLKQVWTAEASLSLYPGLHRVEVRFTGDILNLTDSRLIAVPRHPYVIPLNDTYRVPFGTPETSIVPPNLLFYTVPVNETVERLVVVYPGDSYYLPASKVVTVEYTLPNISVSVEEDRVVLRVSNALPDALVSLYCDGVLVYQVNLTGPTFQKRLPFTCTTYKVLYSVNGKHLVYTGSNIIAPEVSSACQAGAPCVPVQPDPHIQAAYIGGQPYTPGTEVVLPAGEYTVAVVLGGGETLYYELVVRPPQETVYIYRSLDGTTVYVDGPDGATVELVLRDGYTLTVGPGLYRLPSPLAYAYSPSYRVVVLTSIEG